MDYSAYTFGSDPSTIILTMMGFMVQDAFLDKMTDGASLLYYFTTIAGLIGMCFIFLMPKKVGLANILGWCFLMILCVVRPTGADTLFYTDIAEDATLDRAVAYGGILTQPELDKVLDQLPTDDDDGEELSNEDYVRYRDVMGKKISEVGAVNTGPTFQDHDVVTFYLKTITFLNTLNLAINMEIVPFGKRAVGGSQNFIEAVKHVRTSDPEASYHTAEFVQACSESGVVRDTAFKPSSSFEDTDDPTRQKLSGTKVSAFDALKLYVQYANYRIGKDPAMAAGGSMLRPPLIAACGDVLFAAESACEGSEKFADIKDPATALTSSLEPIIVTSDGGGADWTKHENLEQVSKNLRDLLQNQTQIDREMLKNTYVTLAVPLNIGYISKNIEARKATNDYTGSVQDVDNDVCREAGRQAGEEGAFLFGLSGSCFADDEQFLSQNQLVVNDLLKADGLLHNGMSSAEPRAAIKLANDCWDMHNIKSARHEAGVISQTELSNTIQKALGDVKNSDKYLDGYAGLTPNERAKFAINLKLEQIQEEYENCQATATEFSICLEKGADEMNAALRVLSEAGQGNDWAAVNAVMQENSSPEFNSTIRNTVSEIGSVVAPVAVWFKGLIGGFTAGTYSEIMPQLIAFGVAVALMLAPLLFILGLMLPMYSINALMIPFYIIAYMLLVKVTFSFIQMFAGIFSSAGEGDASILNMEQAAIADIAMGNAYAAAFLVTGAIAMMLRSPSSIVQKIAGGADKASGVSFQEVMAAGGIMAAAKKIGGTAATVATGGTAAAVGKAVGTFKAGGYNWGNQYESGKLAGMSDAHASEEGAATYRALESGGGNASDIIKDTKRSKGQLDGATMRQKADPNYKANVEAEFLLEDAEKSSKDMLKADDMGKLAKDVKVTKTRDDGSTYEKNVDSMMTEVVEDLASKLQQQLPEGHPAKTDARRAQAMAHGVFRNMYKEGAFSQVNSKRLGGAQGPDQDLVKTFKRVAEKYAARDPSIAKEIKGDN